MDHVPPRRRLDCRPPSGWDDAPGDKPVTCRGRPALNLALTVSCVLGHTARCDAQRPTIAESIRDLATAASDSGLNLRTFLLSPNPRTEEPIRILYLLVNGQRMREVNADPDLFNFDVLTAEGDTVQPYSAGIAITRSFGDLALVTLDVNGMIGSVVDLACIRLGYGLRSQGCLYGFRLSPGAYQLITTYRRGPREGAVRPGFERIWLVDTLRFRVLP